MKETLTLTGKIELSRAEITQAISEWLQRNKKGAITRAIYLVDGDTIKSGVFDVTQDLSTGGTIPEFSLPKYKEEESKRKMPTGWKRVNVGVFKTIQGFIEEYKSKKLKEVTFDKLLEDVTYIHQKMTRERLAIYIKDKRQLKGVNYDSRTKIIKF